MSTTPRPWAVIVVVILSIGCVGRVPAAGDESKQDRPSAEAEPVIRKGPISVRLRERGALLLDAFDGDKIDLKKWRIWLQSPKSVKVGLEKGRFVIRAAGPIGHNGLWSLNPAKYKDVTLMARMDVHSDGPVPHQLLLHLCGGDMPRSPDHWVEIAMSDIGGGKVKFVTFAAVEKGAFRQWRKELVLPRQGEGGFLARVRLDGGTNLSHLEVRDAEGKWRPIVDPVPLRLRTTHCEVKMRRSQKDPGDKSTTSVGWFDDVRIYPRAATHPVLVRLVTAKGGRIFTRDGESWPPRIRYRDGKRRSLEDLVVELWTADGKTRIAKAQSPHFAHYMLPLKGAPWDAYPVAAKIKVLLDGKSLGEVDIPVKGLDGLYPDDVYDVIVR